MFGAETEMAWAERINGAGWFRSWFGTVFNRRIWL